MCVEGGVSSGWIPFVLVTIENTCHHRLSSVISVFNSFLSEGMQPLNKQPRVQFHIMLEKFILI